MTYVVNESEWKNEQVPEWLNVDCAKKIYDQILEL